VLSPHHPIRRAFFKHGTNVTKHWLVFLILSVALAVLFCYPAFFFYANPSAGFSQLPHHEWMSVREYSGNQTVTADVVIRQAWIHGSYMHALEPSVLKDALEIQNAVLYGEFLDGNEQTSASYGTSHDQKDPVSRDYDPSSDMSWGFHSPLMYWNSSSAAIADDQMFVETIADQASRRSYINLTLLPSSVFAGKTFDGNKLVAADALVLTLFDRSPSSHFSRLWNERLSHLAGLFSDRWSFYPEIGTMARNNLYRFQFKPISTSDDMILISLYFVMLVYVAMNLSKAPRAVKSPLGLIITVVTEVFIST
jgi:hypothetical protein